MRFNLFRFKRRELNQENTIYNLFGFKGNGLRDKTIQELLESYKGWVYGAISKTAQRVSTTPLHLFRKMGDKKVELKNHYILDLLKTPNPFMNQNELFEATTIYLELVGNAYWLLLGEKRYPQGIWILNPARLNIKVKKEQPFVEYEYIVDRGQRQKLNPEKVIDFKYVNPLSSIIGYSPTQAISYEFDILNSMSLYEKYLFENFGQLGGIIEGARNVEEVRKLQKQWESIHRGIKKAGMPAFLTGDLKFKGAPSIKDLLLPDMREKHRTEMLAILGVPPSKLGLTEHVNRANAEANDYTFNKEKVEPILRKIENKLNGKLTPIFSNALILEFENIIPADKEFNLKKNVEYAKNGIYTINEIREEDGRPPVDWGDQPPAPKSPLGLDTDIQEKRTVNIKRIQKYNFDKGSIMWNKYIKKTLTFEEKLFLKVRARFKKEEREIIHNLFSLKQKENYKRDWEDILNNLTLESALDPEAWIALISEIMGMTIKEFITATGLKFGIQIDVGFLDLNAASYLHTHIPKIVGNITNTTKVAIEGAVKKGYEAGESIDQMAKRIHSIFDSATLGRAKTIARTEITGGSNYGILKGFEGADIEKKIWITARDELVRTTPFDHTAAEGETVSINDSFKMTGEMLDTPGDPTGSAANVINCRCTMDGE